MKNKKILIILLMIIFLLSLILYFSCNWVISNFSYTNFDEILYTIMSPSLSANRELIFSCIKNCFFKPVFFFLVLLLYSFFRKKYEFLLSFKIKNKIIKFDLNGKFITKCGNFLFMIFVFWILYQAVNKLGNELFLFKYIRDYNASSTFIEDNYVDPRNVTITFPDKKRNLIYIYLESMESTYASLDEGGAYEHNYIPELTLLAKSKNTINFSNSELLGGGYTTSCTTWTIADLIAQTSGLPLKVLFDGSYMNYYYKSILPGAYSLGEILEKNGYNNYIMVGSDISFGARDMYFENHGNYKIYDYNTAKEDKIIASDYFEFWGMEDEKTFDYAKQELLKISKSDTPFNFTMLTVDTHANDGYTSDFCKNVSDNQYLNAISCSSYQVSEFVKWIKKQNFYENTTIVITGDHLSMNNYSFDDIGDYNRNIYNLFINSSVSTDNNKNREFSTYDIYPTTLASLGVQIEGNQLGLGVNLFSDKNTIIEKYGFEYVDNEIAKKSLWYNQNIMINNKTNFK